MKQLKQLQRKRRKNSEASTDKGETAEINCTLST